MIQINFSQTEVLTLSFLECLIKISCQTTYHCPQSYVYLYIFCLRDETRCNRPVYWLINTNPNPPYEHSIVRSQCEGAVMGMRPPIHHGNNTRSMRLEPSQDVITVSVFGGWRVRSMQPPPAQALVHWIQDSNWTDHSFILWNGQRDPISYWKEPCLLNPVPLLHALFLVSSLTRVSFWINEGKQVENIVQCQAFFSSFKYRFVS